MTAKTITLSNGLTILLDHFNSNTLSIGLWLNVGSVNENNKQLGIAHMLEHMAFKGTKTRNAFDISKEIEDVGGDINAYTSKENTAYYVKLLPSNYELGIEILSDIFLNSTFPKEEIERERGVIISEIGQSNDMPDDKVFDKFYSLAYQNQSIGKPILGTKVSVGGFNKDDLKEFCNQNYNPSNLIIGISGKFDERKIINQIKKNFEFLKSGNKSTKPKYKWNSGFHSEKKDLQQAHIVFGVEGLSNVDKQRLDLSALSIILGGGMSSKLFQEIREKKGLCYSIFSFQSQFLSSGIFGFYSACNPNDLENLLDTSLNEIKNLSKNITINDLDRAKAQLSSGFIRAQDFTFSRLERNVKSLFTHSKMYSEDYILKKISELKISNLLDLYDRLFHEPKTVLSIIGPDQNDFSNLKL
tara:strand:- start:758 stop:1999 length:1242 start_codon:yes stop_codon:yes gene_type:complete